MNDYLTPEKLALQISSSYDAMVRYKNHICLAALNFTGTYDAVVYEYIDEPEVEFSEIECRITRIAEAKENFKDSGSALAWCFEYLNK